MNNLYLSEFYRKIKNFKDGKIYSGLYEHYESDTGGPFITYVFENDMNNELILITCLVNNPGKSKYLLIKQLESIINNIKRY